MYLSGNSVNLMYALRLFGCGAFAVSIGFIAGMSGFARSAQAETLFDALVSAYVGNPALNAARSGQMAVDEEVPTAHSGWRPTVSFSGITTFQNTNTNPAAVTDGDLYPKSYSFSLSQPIFRGFRTLNAVREAEANVRAGRQDLKAVEQTTLLSAATAYMDVVRDLAIVRLTQNNVSVLSEQLSATRDRNEVGEVTKTDVAQAQARRASAVSRLSLARAEVRASKADYKRVVGNEPYGLGQPGSLAHVLPNSLDEALLVGLEEHPDIVAAEFRSKASRHAVDAARGELLPEVSLEASYSNSFGATGIENTESTTVSGRVTVPLYQAGAVSANIRQSKHTYYQLRDQLEDTRNRVRSEIVTAWSLLQAQKAQLVSDQTQVQANRTALEGVREEEKVGQRTVLDVLDAEQEYLDSRVELVSTQRDLVVATFTVLSAIGRLTANDLGLPVEFYDPEEHYNKVRRKWFGTGPRLPREGEENASWQAK